MGTIKVTLRQKPILGERQSLYLDFYPAIIHPETGKPTRREFLGMYIANQPKKPLDKQQNKETLAMAEAIRAKRENELNKPEIYTGVEREQLRIKELGERSFLEYFQQITKKQKGTNQDTWVSASHYLERFCNGKLLFKELTETFCNDYRDYLLTAPSLRSSKATLSQNSVQSYFNKLKAALKQAFKEGLLQTDLNAKIERVKPAETQRNFLTIEELNTLAKTECNNPILKKAALFSALTGLRFSDIEKMVWGEVHHFPEQGYFLQFQQQKTKGMEVLPISKQAFELMGDRQEPDQKVFEGLKYSAYQNTHLYKWLQKAGIAKDITFHCFRHTFATLQLSKGTDIYTVSKMLGHRELKTTQLYAKVVDQSKREAANKILLDF